MSGVPKPLRYEWRAILDRLDADLLDSEALADPAVFHARLALGHAIGCLLDSVRERRPITVTPRTFPVYTVNGPLHTPLSPAPHTAPKD